LEKTDQPEGGLGDKLQDLVPALRNEKGQESSGGEESAHRLERKCRLVRFAHHDLMNQLFLGDVGKGIRFLGGIGKAGRTNLIYRANNGKS